MDATDETLRYMSSDFGNFVADAVKAATGADIALLNSGAFRIDGRVPSKVTRHRLRDVFVHDKRGSVAMVKLSVDEVLQFYDHAIASGGHGAFFKCLNRENPPKDALVFSRSP